MYKKALFLDRDGVISRMVLYENGWDSAQKPGDVKLVTKIDKIISWANQNKLLVIEISNQPGVAKGKMSQKTSNAIEKRVHELLLQKNAYINRVFICPHHPSSIIPKFKINCDCRKPKPGLILKAAKEFRLNLNKSLFIGDKASDALAGKFAGLPTLLFLNNNDEEYKVYETRNSDSDYKADSIDKVFKIVKSYFKSR